jgi:hypothetical protein
MFKVGDVKHNRFLLLVKIFENENRRAKFLLRSGSGCDNLSM